MQVVQAKPHKDIRGDASMKEIRVGQTTIRIHRPQLTKVEREERMKLLIRAAANCYKAR
jgi:hypothetical protein